MKILIKCINAGVNNSKFIGERACSEAFLPNKYGGGDILAVHNMGRSRSYKVGGGFIQNFSVKRRV